ncbi:Imm10 family immunity protein [Neobacillus sp. PS3-34]|uniref:Imm10 family immunity protein n=1 Tax=Neobacillus sp. PS3-34 TaxID=3070678 RepID=UPI0027E20771|nr:Imm10 family immunity protein [Neobacillus sp. PS3-34]WML46647.1 Imm10 family immunity protein [Neobacillus sp. PS3-34]
MQNLFRANFLYPDVDRDTNILMIGFADAEFNTKEYILLQKSLAPGEQDKELGLDEIHIEYNDQIHSTYGGILNVELNNDCIEIELDDHTARQLQTGKSICVSFDKKNETILTLEKNLTIMFQDYKVIFKSKL